MISFISIYFSPLLCSSLWASCLSLSEFWPSSCRRHWGSRSPPPWKRQKPWAQNQARKQQETMRYKWLTAKLESSMSLRSNQEFSSASNVLDAWSTQHRNTIKEIFLSTDLSRKTHFMEEWRQKRINSTNCGNRSKSDGLLYVLSYGSEV